MLVVEKHTFYPLIPSFHPSFCPLIPSFHPSFCPLIPFFLYIFLSTYSIFLSIFLFTYSIFSSIFLFTYSIFLTQISATAGLPHTRMAFSQARCAVFAYGQKLHARQMENLFSLCSRLISFSPSIKMGFHP